MKSQLKRLRKELVRRRVVRTGAAYAAVAFVTLQLGEILFPAYGVGPEGMRALLTGLVTASPLALAASWVYDVTAPRITRTPGWQPAQGETGDPEPPRIPAICVVLLTAMGLGGATWLLLSGAAASSLLLIGLPSILACLAALFAVAWCYISGRGCSTPPQGRAVAVLPFLTLGSSEVRDLGEALAEGIRIQLQLEYGLPVAARLSCTTAASGNDVRALGRFLGVSTIVEGSLVRCGNELRVSAQLVDTTSGFRVSSHSWAFRTSEGLAPQDRMAETITSELLADERGLRLLRAM